MMLEPSIDKLLDQVDSKYSLVVLKQNVRMNCVIKNAQQKNLKL